MALLRFSTSAIMIMGHARSAPPLALSEDQQNQIEQWLSAMGTPQQVALRCRIVLAAAGGEPEAAIASALEINRKTVRLWRKRFAEQGLTGSLRIFELDLLTAGAGFHLIPKPEGFSREELSSSPD